MYTKVLSESEIEYLYEQPYRDDINSNLFIWYPMNEGSGNTVYDEMGNYNGSINGAQWSDDPSLEGSSPHVYRNNVSIIDGKLGKAVEFTDTEQYLESDLSSYDLSNITYCFWLNTAILEKNQRIVDFKSDNFSHGLCALHLAPSNNSFGGILNGEIGLFDWGTSNSVSLEWNYDYWWVFVAASISSSGEMTLFVHDKSVFKTKSRYDNSIKNLTIGNSSLHDTQFFGTVDQFRIYNKILTLEEMESIKEYEIYHSGFTLDKSVLFNFTYENGISGKYLLDNSPNNNKGVVKGDVSLSGEDISLNNGYVLLGDKCFNFHPNQEFSLLGWVYVDSTPTNVLPIIKNERIYIGIKKETLDLFCDISKSDLYFGSIEKGKYNHFVLVYNNYMLKLYLNGEEINNKIVKPESMYKSHFIIGAENIVGKNMSENGLKIDKVKGFNRTLSQTEIGSIYKEEQPFDIYTLLIEGKFQEIYDYINKDGSVRVDESGNSYMDLHIQNDSRVKRIYDEVMNSSDFSVTERDYSYFEDSGSYYDQEGPVLYFPKRIYVKNYSSWHRQLGLYHGFNNDKLAYNAYSHDSSGVTYDHYYNYEPDYDYPLMIIGGMYASTKTSQEKSNQNISWYRVEAI